MCLNLSFAFFVGCVNCRVVVVVWGVDFRRVCRLARFLPRGDGIVQAGPCARAVPARFLLGQVRGAVLVWWHGA